MLLVNIIENALKHSNLEQDESAWVKVHAEISEEGSLVFMVENSVSNLESVSEPGGHLGCPTCDANSKSTTPGDYQMEMKSEGQIFSATLRLNLKKA